MKHVLVLCLVFVSSPTWARHAHPEKYYQELWCDRQAGIMEVVMSSGSRCDCLTDTHAVEFDFARKWAESVGQALNYAAQTGRRAGIVLILDTPEDRRFAEQIKIIQDHYGLALDVWIVDAEGRDLGMVEYGRPE